jgi:hypothetical protein
MSLITHVHPVTPPAEATGNLFRNQAYLCSAFAGAAIQLRTSPAELSRYEQIYSDTALLWLGLAFVFVIFSTTIPSRRAARLIRCLVIIAVTISIVSLISFGQTLIFLHNRFIESIEISDVLALVFAVMMNILSYFLLEMLIRNKEQITAPFFKSIATVVSGVGAFLLAVLSLSLH